MAYAQKETIQSAENYQNGDGPYDIQNGILAAQTFELPTFGTQWKGEPQYKINGRPFWKLNSFSNKFLLDYSVNPAYSGIFRAYRSGALRFDPARPGFIQPAPLGPTQVVPQVALGDDVLEAPTADDLSKHPILAGQRDGRAFFGIAGGVCPIVSFFAPYTGQYVVEARADKAHFNAPVDHLALNMTVNQGRQFRSASPYYVERSPGDDTPLQQRMTVDLYAGEEIALIANSNTRGRQGSAYWENFSVKIAYFSTPK